MAMIDPFASDLASHQYQVTPNLPTLLCSKTTAWLSSIRAEELGIGWLAKAVPGFLDKSEIDRSPNNAWTNYSKANLLQLCVLGFSQLPEGKGDVAKSLLNAAGDIADTYRHNYEELTNRKILEGMEKAEKVCDNPEMASALLLCIEQTLTQKLTGVEFETRLAALKNKLREIAKTSICPLA